MEIKPVTGDSLLATEALDVVQGQPPVLLDGVKWTLRGITSNERYITGAEKASLQR